MTDILVRILEVIIAAYIVIWPAAIICIAIEFSRDVIRVARRGGIGRVR